jgi:hypothetical protein
MYLFVLFTNKLFDLNGRASHITQQLADRIALNAVFAVNVSGRKTSVLG